MICKKCGLRESGGIYSIPIGKKPCLSEYDCEWDMFTVLSTAGKNGEDGDKKYTGVPLETILKRREKNNFKINKIKGNIHDCDDEGIKYNNVHGWDD